MRAVAVFFLSLCFFLLGGRNGVFAAKPHHSTSHSAIQRTDKQQIKIGNTCRYLFLISNNNLTEKKEDFTSVEDEGDEEDGCSARKQVLPLRYAIRPVHSAELIYICNCLSGSLPFCEHLSYTSSFKYILQRVLRI